MPADPQQGGPDTFRSAAGFAIAMLPALVLVGVLFPDGADCAPGATDCGSWLSYTFDGGLLPALLVVAGGVATLAWLAFGLKFFVTRLRAMPIDRARNALFLYAILTCAVFFFVLPLAIVTVILVAVFGEIVLRLARRSGGGAS